MYSARRSPRLRQGDILGPLPLPLLGTEFSIEFKSKTLIQPALGAQEFNVTLRAEEMLVTVISHDCEFNEGKRNKLLVARLQKVRGNLDAEQRADLRASNDVEARAAAELPVAGVDGFIFDPVDGLFDEEQAASFTTITPLPMKMKDELYAQKRVELDHDSRVLFRRKLAWFFGRDAEDIPDEEKIDPPGPEQAVDA